MSSLQNLEKGTAFPSLLRLDLNEKASVSLSRYFCHGLLEAIPKPSLRAKRGNLVRAIARKMGQ